MVVASNAVGGLYVAVGIEADKALRDLNKLNEQVSLLAKAMSSAGKSASLSGLSKELDRVTRAAQQTQKAIADIGRKSTGADAGTTQAFVAAEQVKQQAVQTTGRVKQQSVEQQVRAAINAANVESEAARRVSQEELKKSQAYQKTITEIAKVQETSKRSADRQVDDVRRVQKAVDSARGSFKALGTGSQELFVGLGAARSGNFFYGLAAAGRYAKNLNSELRALPPFVKGLTVGIAGVGLAAATAAVGVGYLGKKLFDVGLQGAKSFQMLQLQLTGLLGSATAASQEMDFILNLGKTSIVPTEALLEANRQLLTFGVTSENVRRSLIQFTSDWGTATAATGQQIYYLNLALGQVAALGKANTIDLRQLANVGISTAAIYEIIGEKIGKTSQEVAAGVSDGLITSELLFAALAEYGTRFEETAEKGRKTTSGLIENIKDIFVIELGRAFKGVNEQIGAVLLRIQGIVDRIDFSGIGQALEQSFSMIKGAFGDIVNDQAIVKFFSVTLPKAIHFVGASIAETIRQVRLWIAVFQTVRYAVSVAVQAIILAIAELGKNVVASVQTIFPFLGSVLEGATEFFVGIAENARAALDASVADVVKYNAEVNRIWSTPAYKPLLLTPQFQNPREVERGAERAPIPDFTWKPPVPEPKGGGSKGKKEDPALEAAREFIEKAKELIKLAADASRNLGEAFINPFEAAINEGYAKVEGSVKKYQSAFEKAFTSGDIDQIISQFNSIRDLVRDYFKPLEDAELGSAKLAKKAKAQRKDYISELRGSANELIRLAAENEALAERIKEAEEKLQSALDKIKQRKVDIDAQYNTQKRAITNRFDGFYTALSATEGSFTEGAISLAQKALTRASEAYQDAQRKLDELRQARDSFLSSLASSARSFVNVLQITAKEVEKYVRLSEEGSFMLTKESGTKDLNAFKQQLQERLDALKRWRQQIEDLSRRGLDSTFLKDLVAAGPQQSADLVEALAAGSAQDITEINRIQQQLNQQIVGVQEESNQRWFAAGIAAQEAFTAPLKAAFEAAQAQLEQLQMERDMALGILEAWYADQNALVQQEEEKAKAIFESTKADLEKKIADNQTKANEITLAVAKRFRALAISTRQSGVLLMEKLLEGMKSKEKELVKEAERIANRIRQTIASALQINSPSKVMIEMGKDIVDGLIIGMEKASAGITEDTINFDGLMNAPVVRNLEFPDVPDTNPEIKVFIGDRELTDIVNVEISQRDARNNDLVVAGRRYL